MVAAWQCWRGCTKCWGRAEELEQQDWAWLWSGCSLMIPVSRPAVGSHGNPGQLQPSFSSSSCSPVAAGLAQRKEAVWHSLGSSMCWARAPGRAPCEEPFLGHAGDSSISALLETTVFPWLRSCLGSLTQGWACGSATVLGLCQEPGQLEPVLRTVGSWCATRDTRDPTVPPHHDMQCYGQGNSS